jgi:hypothetical protein
MTAIASNPETQQFWNAVAQWPEDAQRFFWEAGARLSAFIGENPAPRRLDFDTSKPPSNLSWWEKALYFYGQAKYNEGVSAQMQGQAVVDGSKWLWGALQGDFNKSPTTGQIVTGGIISMIPFVDQLCDVRDVIANCLTLESEEERAKPENWIALGLTCFGFIPEIGSAVKTVGKSIMRPGVRLIEVVKHMEWLEKLTKKLKIPWGRAPLDWLRKYDWIGAAKAAGTAAKRAFENALKKTEAAARWASGAIREKLIRLSETFKAIIGRVEEALSNAASKVKAKIDDLLGKEKKEIGQFDATPGSSPNHHAQGEAEPPRTPPPRPPRMDPHRPRCFKPGDDLRRNWRGDPRKLEKEFYEQLKAQEEGINRLTVSEYLENRARYAEVQRAGTGAAQQAARDQLSREIYDSVLESMENRGEVGAAARAAAREKTKEIMSGLAALHDPDMIAGGHDQIRGIGDKKVNSSIGSQWPKEGRLEEMDNAARRAQAEHGPNTRMNVTLERCK